MEKHNVDYQGGESRFNPGQSVDYMLVVVDDTELYAERNAQDDENANYDDLRAEIIAQAGVSGIPVSALRFWYDKS